MSEPDFLPSAHSPAPSPHTDRPFAKAAHAAGLTPTTAGWKPQRSRPSREAWIYLGILGGCLTVILVAAAIPVYQGPPPSSPWFEAKSNAGLVHAAFRVLKAENSGTLGHLGGDGNWVDVYTGGVGPINYSELDLDATEFDGTNFVSTDYRVAAIDTRAGTWTIAVSSSVAGGPTGTYTIDETGTTGGDAP